VHKALVAASIVLGVLALLGTGLWCAAGAGRYGSPLAGARPDELRNVLILLAAGPLSILPAGLLARKRPVAAGTWLLAAGGFCFFWHLGAVQREGFRGFEAWLPALLIGGPMLLLGAGFLKVGWFEVDSARVLRRLKFVAAALAAAALVWAGIAWLSRPLWEVTVLPPSGETATLRFNPRPSPRPEGRLEELFSRLFTEAGPDRQAPLGSYRLVRRGGRREVYTLMAERDERGLLRVLRNGFPLDRNWMTDEPALWTARKVCVDEILDAAAREYPSGRSGW
jgi:hypothetical protein